MKLVEILSEFCIMLILLRTLASELKLILYMFVLMAIMTDVKSVEPPAPDPIAAEFVLMLIMFAVILSEFAPIAMTTEVKSVEPPPPAPIAIAAELAAMTIILSEILSAFALMLYIFALITIMF